YPSERTSQSRTLSLHDALPIYGNRHGQAGPIVWQYWRATGHSGLAPTTQVADPRWYQGVPPAPGHAHRYRYALRRWLPPGDPGRSEEHTSELQSRENLVCRLLL